MKKLMCFALICLIAVCAITPVSLAEVLRIGDTGGLVTTVQQRLRDLHYYKGKLDGKYGKWTANAIWHFQKDHGLTADGKAGEQTLIKLGILSSPKRSKLYYGLNGEGVLALQKALQATGDFTGTPDGKYGNNTWIAVWRYQRKKGLKVDGVAGPETLASLGLSSAPRAGMFGVPAPNPLRVGSSGDRVVKLQKRLAELNYYSGPIDGKFESVTRVAVWDFQNTNGLRHDGVAGRATLSLLYSDQALPFK